MTEFDKVIHPGGVGKVSAAMNTTTFKGPVAKSITVTTNDPAMRSFSLQLKGTVLVPLDVLPNENVTFNGKSDALTAQVLTVSSTDKSVFDILSVTPSDQAFKTTVVAAPETGTAPKAKTGTVASGANRYQITITPAGAIPIGRLNATVTLKTTHPKASEQVIRLFGTITGDVDVMPPNVSLGTGASATPEAKVQHVLIRKAVGDPLKILGVTAADPQLATTLKTVKEGREYDLEVKYTGPPKTTAMSSKVTVTTNDARQPTLDIPVWGRADAPPRTAPGSPQATMPMRPPPSP